MKLYIPNLHIHYTLTYKQTDHAQLHQSKIYSHKEKKGKNIKKWKKNMHSDCKNIIFILFHIKKDYAERLVFIVCVCVYAAADDDDDAI